MPPWLKISLEYFSLFSTPISFCISLVTFCFTAKIKKRVSNAVDRNKLNLRIEDLIKSLDSLRISLDKEPSHGLFSEIRVALVEIQSEYSFLNKDLTKDLNLAIKMSTFPKSLPIDESKSLELSNLLIKIKSKLRKEVEHYE